MNFKKHNKIQGIHINGQKCAEQRLNESIMYLYNNIELKKRRIHHFLCSVAHESNKYASHNKS